MQRIVIHAGTPKTGTTSLQYALAENRDLLTEYGWLYPATPVNARRPKHQWIVDDLINADGASFREHMNSALSQATEASRIVLSAEGVFNLWWDYPDASKALLAELRNKYEVEVWVWFREPVSFFSAFYVQIVKNPRSSVVPCQGLDLSPIQMFEYEWFRRRLDYIGYVDQVRTLLGAEAVRVFKYRRSTVADFVGAAGLPPMSIAEREDNQSIGELGLEIVRSVNRRDMPHETRAKAINLVEQIDALDGRRPLEMSAAVTDRVRELTAVSIERLKAEFGVDFGV